MGDHDGGDGEEVGVDDVKESPSPEGNQINQLTQYNAYEMHMMHNQYHRQKIVRGLLQGCYTTHFALNTIILHRILHVHDLKRR